MPSIPAIFAYHGQEDKQKQEAEPSDPDNSRPVNFDTFVPHHDPSLFNGASGAALSATQGAMRSVVPPAPDRQITQDQAFDHAMGAWYWAGYWTGVYHVSSARPLWHRLTSLGVQSTRNTDIPHTTQAHGEDDLTGTDVIAMDDVEQEYEVGSQGEKARVEEDDLIPT